MVNFVKQNKISVAVFFLAILTRIIFFFISLDAHGGNIEATVHGQDGYFEISRNLLEGNGFSINPTAPFLPYSYGVPGYPYFLFSLLWLTGGSYGAVGMIQIILGACVVLIGMRLTRLMVPSYEHLPLAVGILLAVLPYPILFSFIFYTETFFTVLFGIFLILFFSFLKTPSLRTALGAGLILGLSTLVKPTVQYLPLLVIAFAVWHFRKNITKQLIIKFACFFFIFIATLAPWLYRNYRTFDMVNLSSQMPFNLYGTLLPSVLAIEHHSSFREEQEKLPINLDTSLAGMNALSKRAIAEIKSHPVALVKLSALNALTFFTHDGMLTFLQALGVKQVTLPQKPALVLLVSSPLQFVEVMSPYLKTSMIFVLFFRLFWIAVTLCFFGGLYKLWRSKLFTPELVFATITVLYFMLTTMVNGLSVNARFRMPVEAILLAIAGVGIVSLYHIIKKRLPFSHA